MSLPAQGAAEDGAVPLVEVCVRYGRTGVVDGAYIAALEAALAALAAGGPE